MDRFRLGLGLELEPRALGQGTGKLTESGAWNLNPWPQELLLQPRVPTNLFRGFGGHSSFTPLTLAVPNTTAASLLLWSYNSVPLPPQLITSRQCPWAGPGPRWMRQVGPPRVPLE